MQLIGNPWTIESVSAHGLAGGFLAATLATLRPLAAGSARRDFFLAPQAASRTPPIALCAEWRPAPVRRLRSFPGLPAKGGNAIRIAEVRRWLRPEGAPLPGRARSSSGRAYFRGSRGCLPPRARGRFRRSPLPARRGARRRNSL